MNENQNNISTGFPSNALHNAVTETLALGQAFGARLWTATNVSFDPTRPPVARGVLSDDTDKCPTWDDQGRAVFRLDNPFAAMTSSAVQKDPCASRDWTIIVILFVLVFTINWTTRWFLWQPLANAVARRTGHKSWHVVETARKFAMNATQASFFGFCSWASYRLIIVHEWSWLTQPDAWFPIPTYSNDDDDSNTYRVSPVLKFYFLLYFSRIASDWVSLHLEMVGRSVDDFAMFWCHHLVTMGLLYTAMKHAHDYFGTGCVLLAFFDWADVPLLTAKAIKYLSAHPQDRFQWTANRLFEVFAVVFFVSRNLMFGFVVHVCWSRVDAWPPRLLLLALFGMQLYWMALIIWAAWRMATHNGVVEDVRELHLAKEKHQ